MSWIQTFTGRKFDLLRPGLEDIDIEDIAHAASMLCRFNGHIRVFYSVAQHSVHVSQHLDHLHPKGGLQGLLHDAAEAYVGDMVRPLKRGMPVFQRIEDGIWLKVCEKYDIRQDLHPDVKKADNTMLVTEARDLMTVNRLNEWEIDLTPSEVVETIEPWDPSRAKEEFLERFRMLERRIEDDGKTQQRHSAV
jgi:5'-deoxynucleotidase YfbR-like HD superfamily hydrolase